MSSAELALTGGLSLGDNVKAKFGTGDDLQIYHTGSVSVIADEGTGNLLIRASDLRIQNSAGSGNYLKAVDGAEVEIMHNGSTKLATTSTGVDVTGSVTCDGFTSTGIDDNATSTAITIDASNNLVKQGGVIKGERGTAAAPAYTFSDDVDTGMFNISNADLGFSVGGSERMRITSDGRGLSQFTAKAWVNFNGTSTVAIRDSHNVSSITDNGTGQYGVNFTGNMTNTNYSVASATSSADWGAMSWVSDLVVGSFKIYHHASNAGSPFYQDGDIMCAQVFGD
jgi:hypothetical protein